MYKRNKYGAKKTTLDGIKFDSKKESQMYANLKLLERGGQIRDLKLQPEFIIQPGFKTHLGKKIRDIKYLADFSFYDIKEKRYRVIDCKGFRTDIYKIKAKMFNYLMRKQNLVLEEEI